MELAVERFRVVGHVRIDPPLRRAEFEYLTAFAESRRWRRPDGPYAVPANPLAECLDPTVDLERYSAPAEGQPGLSCPWLPAHQGHALVPGGPALEGCGVPAPQVAAWLRYLLDHFLRPGGRAARSDGPAAALFAEFGFDHVLDGAAAICSDTTGDLWIVRVTANHVVTEVVGPSPQGSSAPQVSGV
jgi:hypothetical protein